MQPRQSNSQRKKFGIIANNVLGIYQSDLRNLAKKIVKISTLAVQLFDNGSYEARLLCAKLFNINDLTEELLEKWVETFENWEICDTFCMGLFAKSKYAVGKAVEWTEREQEFERRTGFTIIAAYFMADKKAGNERFEQFFSSNNEAFDRRTNLCKKSGKLGVVVLTNNPRAICF